jgi:hypothetical protein
VLKLGTKNSPQSRQCPGAIIIPDIHWRPDNHTRIYHSNLCQWYCSTSHGEWSAIVSQKLQTNLAAIQSWFKKWRIKGNGSKSVQTHSPHEEKCAPPVHTNNVQLRQDVKYLGLHLDRRLIWHKHIIAKRKQLRITLTKMYWFLWRKSKLSKSNKFLIYRTILKPIWTYRIQLWGTASTSNIEILERFQ